MKSKFKNIFSQFIWTTSIQEHNKLKSYMLPQIEQGRAQGDNSPDWYVDTSYDMDHTIDWWPCIEVYKKYVNEFHNEYFGQYPNWQISGEPWYTAYGKNQSAQVHDHIPDHFSVLHLLKYDKEVHKPTTFINPLQSLGRALYTQGPIADLLRSSQDFRGNGTLFNNWFFSEAKEGDIVIWPSVLEHFVQKNEVDDLRATIAFNYLIE